MSSVENNYRELQLTIPEEVTLVAVSKFHTDATILEAYNAGCRIFAESRTQEFVGKYDRLPKDIKWHFIGHLQRNKVRDVVGKASLIQSIDSLRLLEAVNLESLRQGLISDVLLEVFVAEEESKHGFSPAEIQVLLSSNNKYDNVRIKGLMAMATNTDDVKKIRNEFLRVKSLFDDVNSKYLKNLSVLSMGMSGDYHIAIECGSNMVRVGTKIFGSRQY